MTDETPAHRKAELPAVKCETTYTESVEYKPPEVIKEDDQDEEND